MDRRWMQSGGGYGRGRSGFQKRSRFRGRGPKVPKCFAKYDDLREREEFEEDSQPSLSERDHSRYCSRRPSFRSHGRSSPSGHRWPYQRRRSSPSGHRWPYQRGDCLSESRTGDHDSPQDIINDRPYHRWKDWHDDFQDSEGPHHGFSNDQYFNRGFSSRRSFRHFKQEQVHCFENLPHGSNQHASHHFSSQPSRFSQSSVRPHDYHQQEYTGPDSPSYEPPRDQYLCQQERDCFSSSCGPSHKQRVLPRFGFRKFQNLEEWRRAQEQNKTKGQGERKDDKMRQREYVEKGSLEMKDTVSRGCRQEDSACFSSSSLNTSEAAGKTHSHRRVVLKGKRVSTTIQQHENMVADLTSLPASPVSNKGDGKSQTLAVSKDETELSQTSEQAQAGLGDSSMEEERVCHFRTNISEKVSETQDRNYREQTSVHSKEVNVSAVSMAPETSTGSSALAACSSPCSASHLPPKESTGCTMESSPSETLSPMSYRVPVLKSFTHLSPASQLTLQAPGSSQQSEPASSQAPPRPFHSVSVMQTSCSEAPQMGVLEDGFSAETPQHKTSTSEYHSSDIADEESIPVDEQVCGVNGAHDVLPAGALAVVPSGAECSFTGKSEPVEILDTRPITQMMQGCLISDNRWTAGLPDTHSFLAENIDRTESEGNGVSTTVESEDMLELTDSQSHVLNGPEGCLYTQPTFSPISDAAGDSPHASPSAFEAQVTSSQSVSHYQPEASPVSEDCALLQQKHAIESSRNSPYQPVLSPVSDVTDSPPPRGFLASRTEPVGWFVQGKRSMQKASSSDILFSRFSAYTDSTELKANCDGLQEVQTGSAFTASWYQCENGHTLSCSDAVSISQSGLCALGITSSPYRPVYSPVSEVSCASRSSSAEQLHSENNTDFDIRTWQGEMELQSAESSVQVCGEKLQLQEGSLLSQGDTAQSAPDAASGREQSGQPDVAILLEKEGYHVQTSSFVQVQAECCACWPLEGVTSHIEKNSFDCSEDVEKLAITQGSGSNQSSVLSEDSIIIDLSDSETPEPNGCGGSFDIQKKDRVDTVARARSSGGGSVSLTGIQTDEPTCIFDPGSATGLVISLRQARGRRQGGGFTPGSRRKRSRVVSSCQPSVSPSPHRQSQQHRTHVDSCKEVTDDVGAKRAAAFKSPENVKRALDFGGSSSNNSALSVNSATAKTSAPAGEESGAGRLTRSGKPSRWDVRERHSSAESAASTIQQTGDPSSPDLKAKSQLSDRSGGAAHQTSPFSVPGTSSASAEKDELKKIPETLDSANVGLRLLSLSGSTQNPQEQIVQITERLLSLRNALSNPGSAATSPFTSPVKSSPLKSSLSYSSETDSVSTPRPRGRRRRCGNQRHEDHSVSRESSFSSPPRPRFRDRKPFRPRELPRDRKPVSKQGFPSDRRSSSSRDFTVGRGPGPSLQSQHLKQPILTRRRNRGRQPLGNQGQHARRVLLAKARVGLATRRLNRGRLTRGLTVGKGGVRRGLRRESQEQNRNGAGNKCGWRAAILRNRRAGQRLVRQAAQRTVPALKPNHSSAKHDDNSESTRTHSVLVLDASRVFSKDSCTEELVAEAVKAIHHVQGTLSKHDQNASSSPTDVTSGSLVQSLSHSDSDRSPESKRPAQKERQKPAPGTESSMSSDGNKPVSEPHTRRIFVKKNLSKKRVENQPSETLDHEHLEEELHEQLLSESASDRQPGNVAGCQQSLEVADRRSPDLQTGADSVSSLTPELWRENTGADQDSYQKELGCVDGDPQSPVSVSASFSFSSRALPGNFGKFDSHFQDSLQSNSDSAFRKILLADEFSLRSLSLTCSEAKEHCQKRFSVSDKKGSAAAEEVEACLEKCPADPYEKDAVAKLKCLSLHSQSHSDAETDVETVFSPRPENQQGAVLSQQVSERLRISQPWHAATVKDPCNTERSSQPKPKDISVHQRLSRKKPVQRSTSLSTERDKLKALFSVKKRGVRIPGEKKLAVQQAPHSSVQVMSLKSSALAALQQSYSQSETGHVGGAMYVRASPCSPDNKGDLPLENNLKASSLIALQRSYSEPVADTVPEREDLAANLWIETKTSVEADTVVVEGESVLKGGVLTMVQKGKAGPVLGIESVSVDMQTEPDVPENQNLGRSDEGLPDAQKALTSSCAQDSPDFIDDDDILKEIDSCLEDNQSHEANAQDVALKIWKSDSLEQELDCIRRPVNDVTPVTNTRSEHASWNSFPLTKGGNIPATDTGSRQSLNSIDFTEDECVASFEVHDHVPVDANFNTEVDGNKVQAKTEGGGTGLVDNSLSASADSDAASPVLPVSSSIVPCNVSLSTGSDPAVCQSPLKRLSHSTALLKLTPERIHAFRRNLEKSPQFRWRTSAPGKERTSCDVSAQESLRSNDTSFPSKDPSVDAEIEVSLNIDVDEMKVCAAKEAGEDIEVQQIAVSVVDEEDAEKNIAPLDPRVQLGEDDDSTLTASISITVPRDHCVEVALKSVDYESMIHGIQDRLPVSKGVSVSVSQPSTISAAPRLHINTDASSSDQELEMAGLLDTTDASEGTEQSKPADQSVKGMVELPGDEAQLNAQSPCDEEAESEHASAGKEQEISDDMPNMATSIPDHVVRKPAMDQQGAIEESLPTAEANISKPFGDSTECFSFEMSVSSTEMGDTDPAVFQTKSCRTVGEEDHTEDKRLDSSVQVLDTRMEEEVSKKYERPESLEETRHESLAAAGDMPLVTSTKSEIAMEVSSSGDQQESHHQATVPENVEILCNMSSSAAFPSTSSDPSPVNLLSGGQCGAEWVKQNLLQGNADAVLETSSRMALNEATVLETSPKTPLNEGTVLKTLPTVSLDGNVILELPTAAPSTDDMPSAGKTDQTVPSAGLSPSSTGGILLVTSSMSTTLSPPMLRPVWEKSPDFRSPSSNRSCSLSPPCLTPVKDLAILNMRSTHSHSQAVPSTISAHVQTKGDGPSSSTSALTPDNTGDRNIDCSTSIENSLLTNQQSDTAAEVPEEMPESPLLSPLDSSFNSTPNCSQGSFSSSRETGVRRSKFSLKKSPQPQRKYFLSQTSSEAALSLEQEWRREESSMTTPIPAIGSSGQEDRWQKSGSPTSDMEDKLSSDDELSDCADFLENPTAGTRPVGSPASVDLELSPRSEDVGRQAETAPLPLGGGYQPDAPAHQSSTFSLDSLLQDKKRNDAVEKEMKIMQEELRAGILKGGIEALEEEAEQDDGDDDDFTVEQRDCLLRLHMENRQIAELHPGEVILKPELCGRLFTESLTPTQCGFSNVKGTSLERLLDRLQPAGVADILSSNIISLTFRSLPCKESILQWMLVLASVHSNSLVVLKCCDQVQEVLQWQMENIMAGGPQKHTWSPAVDDLLQLFVNWGATPDDLKATGIQKEDISSRLRAAEEHPPPHVPQISQGNIQAVLKMLASCLQSRPSYSSQELTQLLIMIFRVALDTSFSNTALLYDFQVCTSSVLECYSASQWHTLVPSMCRQLSSLAEHHHNKVYLTQLLPTASQRSIYLRQRLAFVLLHGELHGNGERLTDETISNFQLREVIVLVPKLKMLLDQDLYRLSSLVHLLDASVGSAFMLSSQSKQLYELIELVRYMISHMKDNVRRLDLIRVKDILVRMCSKWDLALKCSSTRQKKIFACYSSQDSPAKMETLKPSVDEDDSCSDDEENKELEDTDKDSDSETDLPRSPSRRHQTTGGDSDTESKLRPGREEKCLSAKRFKTEPQDAEGTERQIIKSEAILKTEDNFDDDDDDDSLPEL